jgi:hypothetical protein
MADFCTVGDIESFLQVTIHTDAVKNASALRAIGEATEAIKNYCHQVIEQVANEVITLDCVGGTKIFLPELPVISVASVVEDGELLVVTDDYKLGQHGILHRVDDVWAAGIQIVTITYTHGYATIPDDVVGVCTRAAARAYQAGLAAAAVGAVSGVASMSLGDYSVSLGTGASGGAGEGIMGASAARMLLLSEKDVLNRYRYVAQ